MDWGSFILKCAFLKVLDNYLKAVKKNYLLKGDLNEISKIKAYSVKKNKT